MSSLLSPTTQNTTGDRYRDLVVGTGGKPLAEGDGCAIRYRALRLGKRSRDGLSGEASTVFSFGYGEDDDKCVRAFFRIEAGNTSGRLKSHVAHRNNIRTGTAM